jgi:hypothetical protein
MRMQSDFSRSLKARALEWSVVLLLVGAITLPFLGKAFHIDDTYYLRVTQNVAADPMDPYAGEINWSDRPLSIFRNAGNPPLLNYYLAPVVAVSGASEVALHAAMIPFFLVLAGSVLVLARRFTTCPWWVLLFALTSAGVVVSGNVMLDVPAAALGTAAIAALVAGTDRNDRRLLLLGAALAGLAPLAKYSALVPSLVGFLYPCVKGKPRLLAWAAVPAAILGVWCLHNLAVYGEVHIATQLGRPFNRPGHGWRDNFYGLLVVAGSLLYLLPALLLRAAASRDRWVLVGGLAAALVVWGLVERYTSGGADAQFLFWSLTGAALIFVCSLEGLRGALPLLRDRRDHEATDSLFLAVWLFGPPVFSTLSVPFQAVRHVLPVLPPLALLGFRYLMARGGMAAGLDRAALTALLVLQTAVTFLVARADADFADAYRDFALRARERFATTGGSPDGEAGATVWFLGHWGWMHYAEKAGFQKLNATGPYPAEGDHLIAPAYADKGHVLSRLPIVAASLTKLDQFRGSRPARVLRGLRGALRSCRSPLNDTPKSRSVGSSPSPPPPAFGCGMRSPDR